MKKIKTKLLSPFSRIVDESEMFSILKLSQKIEKLLKDK